MTTQLADEHKSNERHPVGARFAAAPAPSDDELVTGTKDIIARRE
jgi:hypothetical protein